MKAVPMPAETVEVLEGGASLLRQFSMKRSCYSANVKNPKLLADLRLLRDRLGAVFDGVEGWQGWVHKVWSIDLSHECTNVLFNHLPTYQRPSFFDLCLDQSLESRYLFLSRPTSSISTLYLLSFINLPFSSFHPSHHIS